MTTKTRPTFTVVVETADWRIERDRAAGDFNAYVAGAGYIGTRETQQAAQALIDQYRYDTMSRAPVGLMSEDEDPFGDPRTDDEKRASIEGWVEFAPCEGYPLGGWEKPHVHPFDDTRTVMVRKPRLFAAVPPALTTTQKLAQALANITHVSTHVVAQDGRYLIQDDADIDCYGGRAGIVATYAPEPADEAPLPLPTSPSELGDTEGDPEDPGEWRALHAVSLQSLAIEAKIVTCAYCRGIHHIQKCPALRHAVFVASWIGVDLGRGLCQLRWRNHAKFTQLLESVTPARLVEYAESYVAFIKDNRPESSLTTHEVLDRWLPLIGGDPGPAAPAMRMAA